MVRLYVEADLGEGVLLEFGGGMLRRVRDVLRLKGGDEALLFNGRDGEWLYELEGYAGGLGRARGKRRTREQRVMSGAWLASAALKGGRTARMLEKASELGARGATTLKTKRCAASGPKDERARDWLRSGAEQSGLLGVPLYGGTRSLEEFFEGWSGGEGEGKRLLFFDEEAPRGSTKGAYEDLVSEGVSAGDCVVLVGPEGGFDEEERELALGLRGLVRLSLGERALRADTAGTVALGLTHYELGVLG